MLEKAFDLDPIPQGQSSSDNRLKDLILGYFLDESFEKVIEIASKLRSIDQRSCLLRSIDQRSCLLTLYSHENLNENFTDTREFKIFKSDYKNDDWNNIIDRFHIPDEKINSNLKDFSKRI